MTPILAGERIQGHFDPKNRNSQNSGTAGIFHKGITEMAKTQG
jgi:hypothetical protein